jgi:hypothetical protein
MGLASHRNIKITTPVELNIKVLKKRLKEKR